MTRARRGLRAMRGSVGRAVMTLWIYSFCMVACTGENYCCISNLNNVLGYGGPDLGRTRRQLEFISKHISLPRMKVGAYDAACVKA